MSEHLTITYGKAATAASPGSTVAGTAGTSGGDSGAGFLEALIDQLLAGSAAAPGPSASATTATTTAPNGTAIDPAALAAAQTTPQGIALVAKLTKTLAAVKAELDAGDKPDPDLLKKLGDTADALAALIALPGQAVAPPPPTTGTPQSTDPLAALTAPGVPTGSPTPPVPPGSNAGNGSADGGSSPGDSQPAQAAPPSTSPAAGTLAALMTLPPATSPAGSPPTPSQATADPLAIAPAGNGPLPTPAAPLPGIAELTSELANVSKIVAESSPAVAQKLDALVQRLGAAQSAPQVLAQIAGAADASGTALDKLVQQLLGNTQASAAPSPAATLATAAPQLATPQLPLPPATTSASATDKSTAAATTPSTQTSTGTSTPTMTLTAVTQTSGSGDKPTSSDGQSKPDAKVIAAATATDGKTDKPDPSAVTAASAANAVQPATTTAPARAVSTAYQSAQPALNMNQVAIEIAHQAQQGASHFTIRLDPPDLGRVDVKMHVDATGNVSARLTVERSETLDMFNRDRGSLERALTQAGLDGGKTSLEFSLRQNPFAGMTGGNDQRPSGGSPAGPAVPLITDPTGDAATAASATTLYRGTASAGGVNLFV